MAQALGVTTIRSALTRTLAGDAEPGNNLDLSLLTALVAALDGFRGAMIVVTHDDRLADELRLDREWEIREFLAPNQVEVDSSQVEMGSETKETRGADA